VIQNFRFFVAVLLLIAPAYAQQTQPPVPASSQPASADSSPIQPAYDPGIFQTRMSPAQLSFLTGFAGAPSGELFHDKQFHKLLKSFVPDCTFHYGSDKSFDKALDEVFQGSRIPVELQDGRYLTLAGGNGPYLAGRAFLWIDLREGIALGAFFFHPTNGEPTPSVNVFSRQVKGEDLLQLTQLPPAFASALAGWSAEANIPNLTTRYFITGSNHKILLEHNENLCAAADGSDALSASDCELFTSSAADIDLTAADYLDATHHATNATAWMISGEDQAWLGTRAGACGTVVNPLGCRIRLTHARILEVSRRGGRR
jgi:hypothetical protein